VTTDTRIFVRGPDDSHAAESRPLPDADKPEQVDLGAIRLVKAVRDQARGYAPVRLSAAGDQIVVDGVAPTANTTTSAPAAAFRSGDVVIAIDGKDTHGIGINGASSLLFGPASSEVTFTVRSEGGEARQVTVARSPIQ